MTRIRIPHRHLVVACELTAEEAGDRLAAWQDLRDRSGLEVGLLDDGARLWLRPDAASEAEALLRSEAACCGFLDVQAVVDGGRLRVDLRSPVPEGAVIARALAGAPASGTAQPPAGDVRSLNDAPAGSVASARIP